jgi:hypothetical protein
MRERFNARAAKEYAQRWRAQQQCFFLHSCHSVSIKAMAVPFAWCSALICAL